MPKASEQAELIWPYILRKIERVTRGTGGSSGTTGTGGAPSPHDLSSIHHTGTLSNTQAPQFLLVDGSRALTGNLAVNAGVTIDGVDLSAHVLDPDAHHARATAGNTAIDVAGQAISLALAATSGLQISSGLMLADSVAGAGLDISSKVLSVNVGDGLEIAADAVAVDLAANSGLLFSSGDLALGTPTAVAYDTLNSVTTTTHTHAVTATSDVGTTPQASLLKSTPSGGLTLASLTARGNVDVVAGGDLTVGANVLFVDVSQESVGILRAPDPQFALDVNGPIRGTELVGKHAIQLDDVALLLHFDGGHPYNSNYTGEPNAIPLGQVPTENTAIHYRPGKFYKCAVMSYGATNLATNPSFETNLTGWNIFNDAGGNVAASRVSDDCWYGSFSAKLTWTTINNSSFYHAPVASAVAGSYAMSVWMRAAVPTTVQIRIQRDTSPFTLYGSKTVTVSEEWQYFTVATTTTPTAGVPLRVVISPQNNGTNSLWVDAVQLEQASANVPYLDGSLGDGHSWSGTAHASTSTRSAGRLAYTLTNMVAHRWTVLLWVWFPHADFLANRGILRMHSTAGASDVELYVGPSGIEATVDHTLGTATVNVSGGVVTPAAWHHIALTYTAGTLRAYFNGTLVSTTSLTLNQAMAVFYVGSIAGPTYGSLMVDDVCVTRQALSDDRVKAIYESDAPVFATSSVFSFRATPKGLVWADEEGLWMRTTTGDPALGAYGGESTKSWAGLILSPGDFVVGDSNRGAYMLWDDSAGSIVIGKTGASASNLYLNGADVSMRLNTTERFKLTSGGVMTINDSGGTAVFTFNAGAGAEFTKPLTLGTSGGIYQGTGTFAAPTIGLKIWNDSGIGRIGGYNGGTLQWYANTDGKLYAAGGNLLLDANGIRITAPSPSPPAGSTQKLTFATAGGSVMGEMYAYHASGIGEQHVYLEAPLVSTLQGAVHLRAFNLASTATELIVSGAGGTIQAIGNFDLTGNVTSRFRIAADGGGGSGTIGLSNVSNTSANSTGVGTVKMKGTTSRDSVGFIKLYNGTTAIWIPYWTTITG